MKPTWVMTDHEKKEKKEKTIKRKILGPQIDKITLQKETRTQYEERMREQRIQSRLNRKRKMKQTISFGGEPSMKMMPPLTPLPHASDSPDEFPMGSTYGDDPMENPMENPETPIETPVNALLKTPIDEMFDMDPGSPPQTMMLASTAAVLFDYTEDMSEESVPKKDQEKESPPTEDNAPQVKEEPLDLASTFRGTPSPHSSSENTLQPFYRVDNSPSLVMSMEERSFIKELWKLELNTSKSVPVPPDVMYMLINAAKAGTVIPIDAAVKGYAVCVQRVIKYASGMDFFNRYVYDS